ncbi:hypothetical protein BCR37DRAFT_228243 [Protomyces lactucae-debilis]|uniref:Uncharacterized protein n=1 Tax=Protomyces lactucae-debilis TaxID=2754530 RepID=A0A1Y2EQV0_PROLT|nr:uncharacterized protein BCR37DRAFT_228243 [Protomyces lactucae-debilis]ORY73912.1 hypothetical protein BCR37DRAFT_228243 [Protomyces lactucae-debilis]
MLLNIGLIASLAVASVSAHGAIVKAMGTNNVAGTALGIDDSVSRRSAGRAAQADTSVIRDRDVTTGAAGPCGKTSLAGALSMNEEIDKVAARNNGQLPTVQAGGDLEMTVHKINEDGAGPFMCDFSTDGETFKTMQVSRNVPGFLGLGLGRVQDFPLVVRIPADVTACSAGNSKDTCMVRCRNAAVAGPFGGCVPIKLEGATTTPATVPAPDATEAAVVAKRFSNDDGDDQETDE